jgi:hypothetical protein
MTLTGSREFIRYLEQSRTALPEGYNHAPRQAHIAAPQNRELLKHVLAR